MHYDPDGRVGRTMSTSDGQLHKDQTWVFKFLLKLVVFPLWILVILLKRRRHTREMIQFAVTFSDTDGISARGMAMKWAAEHHRKYPFAEYSSNFPKLESEFQHIISNSPQLNRRSMS